MKVAAAVAEILKREGVQFLIGYPVNPIIEAAAEADIRTVGLAIVRTLNRHTRLLEHIRDHHGRLLERIDRKLGPRGNGRPGQGNGRGV